MEEEKFKGFDPSLYNWSFPTIINGWVHKLSGSEFKVLWYILRHTYGWQKDSDTISYNQFRRGIKKKEGIWLDKGTGLGLNSIKKAIRGLIDKGFIETERKRDEKGRLMIVSYKPRYTNPPMDKQPLEKRHYNNNIYNNNKYINNNSMSVKEDILKKEIEILKDKCRYYANQVKQLGADNRTWKTLFNLMPFSDADFYNAVEQTQKMIVRGKVKEKPIKYLIGILKIKKESEVK